MNDAMKTILAVFGLQPIEPPKRDFEFLQERVLQWADERDIIGMSTPTAQAAKTLEELGELFVALGSEAREGGFDDIQDAYGDILVTLIIGSYLADVDLVQALDSAYLTIRGRTGYINAAGIFVKEEA